MYSGCRHEAPAVGYYNMATFERFSEVSKKTEKAKRKKITIS